MLTQKELKECIFYDPDTGVFERKFKDARNRLRSPKIIALRPSKPNGRHKTYCRIMVFGKRYQAHALAWLYVYGYLPKEEIDHLDGDGCNNRISNLRQVTRAENCKNKRIHSNNSSGAQGVSFHRVAKKWMAYINVNGVRKTIGFFESFSEAKDKRDEFKAILNYHPNHGTNRDLNIYG